MVTGKPSRLATLALERSPWRSARWLVIAPHADDETLGAGALIRQAAEDGGFAGLVVLTDGAGSHDHPDASARARLVAARRLEARRALRRLAGPSPSEPLFLDWPDACPADPGSGLFETTARRLAAVCRARRVDAIAATAPDEPHCDHEAAGRLARQVARLAKRPIAVFDYVVWGTPPLDATLRISTRPLQGGARASALSAHRSQLTSAFGPGFRLETDRRLRPTADILYRRNAYV